MCLEWKSRGGGVLVKNVIYDRMCNAPTPLIIRDATWYVAGHNTAALFPRSRSVYDYSSDTDIRAHH
jgi:hypothetical protein